jgi:hypothetical protein
MWSSFRWPIVNTKKPRWGDRDNVCSLTRDPVIHNPNDLQEANRCCVCQRRLPHLWRSTPTSTRAIPAPASHLLPAIHAEGSGAPAADGGRTPAHRAWMACLCCALLSLRASCCAVGRSLTGCWPGGRRLPVLLTGTCCARGTAGNDAEIGLCPSLSS